MWWRCKRNAGRCAHRLPAEAMRRADSAKACGTRPVVARPGSMPVEKVPRTVTRSHRTSERYHWRETCTSMLSAGSAVARHRTLRPATFDSSASCLRERRHGPGEDGGGYVSGRRVVARERS